MSKSTNPQTIGGVEKPNHTPLPWSNIGWDYKRVSGDSRFVISHACGPQSTSIGVRLGDSEFLQPSEEASKRMMADAELILTAVNERASLLAQIEHQLSVIGELREQNDDLQKTFDLMWEADMRAIDIWQAANPGNDLVWPDRSKLTLWLLEWVSQLQAAVKPFAAFAPKAEQFVRGTATFGGSPIMPSKDFRLADFQRAAKALSHPIIGDKS